MDLGNRRARRRNHESRATFGFNDGIFIVIFTLAVTNIVNQLELQVDLLIELSKPKCVLRTISDRYESFNFRPQLRHVGVENS